MISVVWRLSDSSDVVSCADQNGLSSVSFVPTIKKTSSSRTPLDLISRVNALCKCYCSLRQTTLDAGLALRGAFSATNRLRHLSALVVEAFCREAEVLGH